MRFCDLFTYFEFQENKAVYYEVGSEEAHLFSMKPDLDWDLLFYGKTVLTKGDGEGTLVNRFENTRPEFFQNQLKTGNDSVCHFLV